MAKKTVPTVQPGQPVVFLCDVGFKSAAGRVSYVARVGITGKVKSINTDGTLEIVVDRRLSARSNVLEAAQPEWVGIIREAEIIEDKKAKEDGPSWKGFAYDDLKKIADHHGLSYRVTPNPKINQMWIIDALKKAGIEPPQAADPGTTTADPTPSESSDSSQAS